MSRKDGRGSCEHCAALFDYYLVHNGFNESSYAYCERCGRVALVDWWSMPDEVGEAFRRHAADGMRILQPCPCGGRFTADAGPRCPRCVAPLSPLVAAEWLERNAAGTSRGWGWQRDWTGIYCIVIEDRVVRDNWIGAKRAV